MQNEDDAQRQAIAEATALRYQARLLDSVGDAVVATDERLVITLWNAAAERMYGWTAEETIGRPLLDLVGAQISAAEFGAAMQRLAQAGRMYVEATHRTKDGRLIDVESDYAVLRDASGRITGYVAVSRDITERKRAEAALRESEARSRTLFESAIEGLIVTDADGTIVALNPAAVAMLGYERADELVGQPVGESYADPAERDALIAGLLANGYVAGYETRLRKKDGSLIWALGNAVLRRDTAGGVAGVAGFFADITERKQSELRYRELLESAPIAIGVANAEGAILHWNQAMLDLYGYDSADDFLRSSVTAHYADPADRQRLMELLERGPVRDFEAPFRRRDGTVFWGLMSAARHEVGLGTYQIIVTIRDITERKHAEEAVRESELRYRGLMEGVPVGIGVHGADGVFVHVNRTLLDMFGYDSVEEFLRTPTVTHYAEPADRQRLVELAEAQGSPPQDFEAQFRRKDGTLFWGSLSGVGHEVRPGVFQYIVAIRDITGRRRTTDDLRESTERLQRALDGAINALATVVEQKDPYTAGHQRRVATLAGAIGRELGLADDRIEGVRVAGLIHDIGKIYVPAEILTKPGALTAAEFAIIRIHPQAAYDTLKGIEFPWPVADIALQHHERLDGSGYPAGLRGDAILVEARIIAVADVVEAMASHRPFRPARGVETALAEIAQNRGALYDADAVDACLRLFNERGYRFE